MRRIRRHGQMRELVNDWDRRNIHRVSRVGLKGSNAALAQNHLVVPARHDVFRRQQQLFQRGRDPALEQHRLAYLPQLAQQIKVLHVARSYLQNIHIGQHHRNLRNLHHLTDYEKFEFLSRLAHQLQRVFSVPLKRIRRTTRLECPAS